MKRFTAFVLTLAAIPAYADVTVSAPAANVQLASPFLLQANASACNGQAIVSMGYSVDYSSNTTIISGASINTQATYTTSDLNAQAPHTLHVKSWGNQGANCTTDVPFTPSTNPATVVPQGATTVSNIQSKSNVTWSEANDGGTTNASTQLATSPSLSGQSREFFTSASNNGNERFSAPFDSDPNAQNFLYDTYVYIAADTTSGGIGNLEFDLNQVLKNGYTVIYGFQCAGYFQRWQYTENTGTVTAPKDSWASSNQACNPANWTTNTWHHVQITYSYDSVHDWVTYKTVWLDGVEQDLGVPPVPSTFALGWASVLLTNFQEDSFLTGNSTMDVYLDNLTVSRW